MYFNNDLGQKQRTWSLILSVICGIVACAGIVSMYGAIMTWNYVHYSANAPGGPLVFTFIKLSDRMNMDSLLFVQKATILLFIMGVGFSVFGVLCSGLTIRSNRSEYKRLGLIFLLLHIALIAVLVGILTYAGANFY